MQRDGRPPPEERHRERERIREQEARERAARSVQRQAEAPKRELASAVEKVLSNPHSIAAERLREQTPDLDKHPERLHETLQAFPPAERHRIRQTLIGEAWATSAFTPDSYHRASRGRTARWEELEPDERCKVATFAERVRAHIEQRSAADLVQMYGTAYGTFDTRGGRMIISLNKHKCLDSANVLDTVRTLAHEGQHLQDFRATRDNSLAPHLSTGQLLTLRLNFLNPLGRGKTSESWHTYRRQPIELSARVGTIEVIKPFVKMRRRNEE